MNLFLMIFIILVMGCMLIFLYSVCRLASEYDREDERLFQEYLLSHTEEGNT